VKDKFKYLKEVLSMQQIEKIWEAINQIQKNQLEIAANAEWQSRRINELTHKLNEMDTTFLLSMRIRNRAETVLKDEGKKRRKLVGGDYRKMWAEIRREFGVSSYKDIPEAYIPKAIQLIRSWTPRIEDPTFQPKQIVTVSPALKRRGRPRKTSLA
jgi:hypothetical protein